MLKGTYQLTGSGVAKTGNRYILGTPRVIRDSLQYEGLKDNEPKAPIQPQNSQVEGLDRTTLWGTNGSRVKSEKPKQPTYMSNAYGNRFVVLGVR